jgi:phosphatidylserine/phosphatidylglycerophosphate/cardiolipin synthase-like enzyme
MLTKNTTGQISIAEARNQALNSSVTIKGVVTNGAELGVIRYIQDNTGGLAIYSTTLAGQINRGDSIQITGTLVDFNGLLELTPASNLINYGTTDLPPNQFVTIPDFNDTLESELVQLNGVTFNNAGGTFTGNTSYTFTSGGAQSTIYIRNGSPIVGQIIPIGELDLIGVCSQFFANYQILPRDMNDFILPEGINIISSIDISNIQQNSVNISWETNIEGTSIVTYGLTPALELGSVSQPQLVTNHDFQLTNLIPGEIYYYQVSSIANGDTTSSLIKVFGTQSNSLGWIKTLFNHPIDIQNGENLTELVHIDAIDDSLIAYINRAEESIDVTIYDFDNAEITSISQAINAAHNRGVIVRFISDGNQVAANFGVNDLIPEIPKLLSPTGGNFTIMHNKFVVIDANHSDPTKPIVWTGSTNWTDRQINRDPNNVIILQDQTLAKTYKIEFDEMWGSSGAIPDSINAKFGSNKRDNTPHEFIIGGKRVECYFSPSDNTNQQIINAINSAEDSLHIATMLITRSDIASTIDGVVQSGSLVKCHINNQSTTTVFSALSATLGSNLSINPDTNLIMHHKFLVADAGTQSDPIVLTGSHNWSNNANTRNDENTIIIHDSLVTDWYRRAFTGLTNPQSTIPTKLNTINLDKEISIFPSVVNSLSDVTISNYTKDYNFNLDIVSSNGSVVYAGKINGNEKFNLSFLNAPKVNQGIYFIRLSSISKSYVAKIIVIE